VSSERRQERPGRLQSCQPLVFGRFIFLHAAASDVPLLDIIVAIVFLSAPAKFVSKID